MTSGRSGCAVGLAAFASLGLGLAAASACGYEGILGNQISEVYPGSVNIAVSIRQAIDAGVLDESVATPIVPGQPGYWRAVGRLTTLQRLLSAAARSSGPAPNISIIFIDSNLWSRCIIAKDGFEMEAHTVGPKPGDVILATAESVFEEILAGRLPVNVAFARGLITIDGAPTDTFAALQLVTAALANPLVSNLNLKAGPVPPIRFFGPSRLK